jgi:ankyrin repeat protein
MDELTQEEKIIVGVHKNMKAFIRVLLTKGADIHYEDDEALLLAIIYCNYGLVKFLVKNGANINFGNGMALETCYSLRKMKTDPNMVRYIDYIITFLNIKKVIIKKNFLKDLVKEEEYDLYNYLIKFGNYFEE